MIVTRRLAIRNGPASAARIHTDRRQLALTGFAKTPLPVVAVVATRVATAAFAAAFVKVPVFRRLAIS